MFQFSDKELSPIKVRMGGRGQGVKPVKSHTVKHFLPSWLDKCIEGVRNSIWLESNPKDHGEARCKICKTLGG